MYSIKTKLVAVITLLVVGLFSVAAFLLIREKQKQLTHDIYFQTRSFAELTAPNIINNYNLYLAQKGFIYFNREITKDFNRTQDVDLIQIFDYSGHLLYDSKEEREAQYSGPVRVISDENIRIHILPDKPQRKKMNQDMFLMLMKTKNPLNLLGKWKDFIISFIRLMTILLLFIM